MRTRASQPSGATTSTASRHTEYSLSLPTVPSPDTRQDLVTLQKHHMDMSGDDNVDSLDDAHHDGVESPAVVEKRRITLKQAEELLLKFREKASFFPFVQIPLEATIPSLSRTSPFLLLAVLTAASLDDPLLHHQMNHEFRRVLGSQVLRQGKKSLDFLQGLLVYIAWFPAHVNPRDTTTTFVYMHLAIDLLIELGLDQESPSPTKNTAITTTGLVKGDKFTPAARRTYLACYYTSSAAALLFPTLKMGWRKPNNRHYRDLLDHHSPDLMHEELQTEIGSLVRLQRLSERIGETNSPNTSSAQDPQTEALTAEVNIQVFLHELQDWQACTSEAIQSLTSVRLAEKFVQVNIYCHPLGFLRYPYREVLRQPPATRAINSEHLVPCLEACKSFFSLLLSLPSSCYVDFTAVQWGYMVQCILVVSRLTFLMARQLGWGPAAARSAVPLGERSADVFLTFEMVLGSVKRSYERRVEKLVSAPVPENHAIVGPDVHFAAARGHCPMLDASLEPYLGGTLAGMDGVGDGSGYGYSGAFLDGHFGGSAGSGSGSWSRSVPSGECVPPRQHLVGGGGGGGVQEKGDGEGGGA
ncbi:hypothetical protein LZ554_000577 [Drepanopeziza brunnea f. sp. 'monogermtubi']|nr:hypothetical protein LZ554_000577 [Drepanopeziza brunnea f. sp. 'monogermtubi']